MFGDGTEIENHIGSQRNIQLDTGAAESFLVNYLTFFGDEDAAIETGMTEEQVREHLEPVLAAGGRTTVGELVEEELLLALPIVPLHAQAGDCAVSVVETTEGGATQLSQEPEQTTQKPFAQLDKLLKR